MRRAADKGGDTNNDDAPAMTGTAQQSRHYDIASKDAVKGMHARFMARLEKDAAAALDLLPADARTPALRDHALDVLMHVARMRVTNFTSEQLSRALEGALRSVDSPAAIQRYKSELSAAADLRERLSSRRFGAASVPQAQMDEMMQAAAAREPDAQLEDVFGGEERIYLSIKGDDAPARKVIAAALAVMPPVRAGDIAGYRITDWSGGYATDHTGKQNFRIGKLLREHAPALLDSFTKRTTENLMVVVSRNLDDIARASTNRAWHSCAGAGRGALDAYTKMPQGVRHGMLIAYLVSDSDPDINDPLARVMLYPFIKDKQRDKRFQFAPKKTDEILDTLARTFARAVGKPQAPLRQRIWYPGKNYGLDNADFDRVVEAFIDEKLNVGGKGCYWQPYDTYHPGFDVVERKGGTTSIKNKFTY